MLSTKYRLFLLSNTDAIHIETFEQKMEPLISDFTTALKRSISPLKLGCESQTQNYKYVLNEHDLQTKTHIDH
jgi:putative hydrolase of the HAD superfamily